MSSNTKTRDRCAAKVLASFAAMALCLVTCVSLARADEASAKLERRLQELEDRFRQRNDEMQTRQRKQKSEAQRADWLREWEQVALSAFDQRAPRAAPQMRLDLHKAISERLGSLKPIPTPQVTAELIADIVKPLVERQREQEEANRIIAEALNSGLPPGARGDWRSGEPSPWQVKLHQTIVTRLSGDQPLDTFQRVVKQAVNDVAQQFEDEQRERQADTADTELRGSVREEVTRSFRHRLRADAQDDLDEAVDAEFAKWPRGAKRHKLVAAIQQAVSPWSQAVEQNDAEQQRLADEAKQQRVAH